MDHRSFHLAAVHELVEGVPASLRCSGASCRACLSVIYSMYLVTASALACFSSAGHDASERALGVVRGNITWAASSDPGERDFREVAFGMVRLINGQFTFLRAPTAPCPRRERVRDGAAPRRHAPARRREPRCPSPARGARKSGPEFTGRRGDFRRARLARPSRQSAELAIRRVRNRWCRPRCSSSSSISSSCGRRRGSRTSTSRSWRSWGRVTR